jgi:hypothetical protein
MSYGCYLLILLIASPSLAYLIAYGLGIISGNILHIKYTHQKCLTTGNLLIQTSVLITIGILASATNGWLSNTIDPRTSGFLIIVISAAISFSCSKMMLR